MEDDLKKIKMKTTKKNNGKRPKQKWKTNQSTKINLIGCDTIVNSPSLGSWLLSTFLFFPLTNDLHRR